MHFSDVELISLLESYLWPFFRIAALVGIAPILGARMVPLRVRLGLALVLTVVIVPTLPATPLIDPLSATGLLVTVNQLIIGVAMGFALLLVFSAFVVGGQVFAMQMGLGFAAMVDPQRGVQVPMISQFYVLVATLVFLALNGHLVLIETLAESFRILPISEQGLPINGLRTLVAWGGQMFAAAVVIALPAIATLMIVNLAFGVMMRAAPQLNIFAVGFPISMTVGFIVMLTMLPAVTPQLTGLVEDIFLTVRRMLLGGV